MELTETKNQHILKISDSQGTNEIRIHKDGSQIQLETGIEDGMGDNVFIDTDKRELTALRDMINKILEK